MRLFSVLGNEDEMMILHSKRTGELIRENIEYKKEFNSLLHMMHCITMGTIASGDLFPAMITNIRECIDKNVELIRKSLRDKQDEVNDGNI